MAIKTLDDLEAMLNNIAETTQATAEAVTAQGEQIAALSSTPDPADPKDTDPADPTDPKNGEPADPKDKEPEQDENEVAKLLGFE